MSLPSRASEQADLSARVTGQIEQWHLQAAKGDASAWFNLGQLYRRGIAVEKDLQQAQRFYKEAAQLGHAGAQLNLGSLYYFAGDSRDAAKAGFWWKQAAQQGVAKAQYQLAVLLINQQKPDFAQALLWMALAERGGDIKAAQAMARWATGLPAALSKGLPAALAQAYANGVPGRPLMHKPSDGYSVQLAVFADAYSAGSLINRLLSAGTGHYAAVPVFVRKVQDEDKTVFRVLAGIYEDSQVARAFCNQLSATGTDCFVRTNSK